MYDVCTIKRTNIYLEERQLDLLGRLADARGTSVADLVRKAIDAWLEAAGARPVGEDEWQRRFRRFLERRRRAARRSDLTDEEVEREVARAVREVREARKARRAGRP